MGTGTGWLDQRLVSSGAEREDCKLEPASNPSQLSGQGDLERSKEQREKTEPLPPSSAPCWRQLAGRRPLQNRTEVLTQGFTAQSDPRVWSPG